MKIVALLAMAIWADAGTTIVGAAGPAVAHRPAFLPSAVEGWTWDGQARHYDRRTVFDYIDGAGELFLAYGFRQLTVRRFEKPGQPPLTLERYDMGSAEGAYGVFSFERQEASVGIGQGSEFGGGLLRFWKGRFFASISANGEGAEAEAAILKLERDTAAAIPQTGAVPRVVGLIPGKDAGLVETSVRYVKSHILLNQRLFIAHENILNLTPQTGAVLAQYGHDAQKTQLLLVRYPTTTAAEAAYQKFRTAYLPDAGGADRRKTDNQRWAIVRQRQAFVLVVLGAPTEAVGEALLQKTETALRRVR
jgi:hypothetical protein